MTARSYILSSMLAFVAAIAVYPILMWLSLVGRLNGGQGMLAYFVIAPFILIGLAAYCIWSTLGRVRQTDLVISYQIPLYASLVGAAPSFVQLPVLIAINIQRSTSLTAGRLFDIVELLIPLGMLLSMVVFVGVIGSCQKKGYNQRLARGVVASTIYLIISLAPNFFWLVPVNPYQIQRYFTLGFSPTFCSILALVTLDILLFLQYREWISSPMSARFDA